MEKRRGCRGGINTEREERRERRWGRGDGCYYTAIYRRESARVRTREREGWTKRKVKYLKVRL